MYSSQIIIKLYILLTSSEVFKSSNRFTCSAKCKRLPHQIIIKLYILLTSSEVPLSLQNFLMLYLCHL